MADSAIPNLAKIAAGDALENSDEIFWAMREILPDAEKWVGRSIVLECDERGWLIRYTHGNSYRDRILDHYGDRFTFAEDAIEALVELIARNKGEVERKGADDAA